MQDLPPLTENWDWQLSATDHGAEWAKIPEFDNRTASGIAESYPRS
jgi:hypothetical protein